MNVKGLIRSYDNGAGSGSVFIFEEEMTLNFSGFPSLGLSTGDRVDVTVEHPGGWGKDQASVTALAAE